MFFGLYAEMQSFFTLSYQYKYWLVEDSLQSPY